MVVIAYLMGQVWRSILIRMRITYRASEPRILLVRSRVSFLGLLPATDDGGEGELGGFSFFDKRLSDEGIG